MKWRKEGKAVENENKVKDEMDKKGKQWKRKIM